MGLAVRAYRHHRHHGRHPLPQAIVAAWVGLTQAQLSRIEHGPPIVHIDRLIHWARTLGVPSECLWFKLPTDDSDSGETKDVKRRSFLAATGTGLVAAAVPQPASLGQTVGGWRRSPLVANLAAAILTPPVGGEVTSAAALTSQVTAAWQLRQRADYEALGHLLPTLIAQVHVSADVLADADRDRAQRILVHAYNSASSLLKTARDWPLALLAADRAVQAARQTEDPVLVAAAMYRQANVLLAAQRLDETQAVALRAADLVQPLRPHSNRRIAFWGGLLLTAAVAAARQADESTAWELMGEARAGSRLLGADHADLYAIFGPTNVAIHGVQVAVELRNGRDAVRRSRCVDPDRLPPSLVERRGQFLIDVAAGHAFENDDVAAVATLLRADAVAPQELRLNPTVHHLVRTLLARERVGAAPGLRDLAGRLGPAG
jgi:hypothetical protein